jgi:hypothetical protein
MELEGFLVEVITQTGSSQRGRTRFHPTIRENICLDVSEKRTWRGKSLIDAPIRDIGRRKDGF